MADEQDLRPTESSRLERQLVAPDSDSIVRAILACKWSLTVFQLLRRDVRRPGAMVASVEGLTTKSLNVCLRRLVEFGIVRRESYPEVPPRVEYFMTPFGDAVAEVFDRIQELERLRAAGESPD